MTEHVRVVNKIEFLKVPLYRYPAYRCNSVVKSSGGSSHVFYARGYELAKPRPGVYSYVAVPVPRRFACSYYFSLFGRSPGDVVCPQFWELKWAVGCPYSCSYCFLQGTFYGSKGFRVKDLSRLGRELEEFLSWADAEGIRVMLNAGELCDSLAVPDATAKLLEVLKGVLKSHPDHRVLLVTKAGLHQTRRFLEGVKGFEELFVVSFSLNSYGAAKVFEVAPVVEDRLRAARAVQDAGVALRIRVDPMIPIDGWEEEYRKLLEDMLALYDLEPERITIGSLRGLRKTIAFSKSREWVKYLKGGEKTGWGLKIAPELRKRMYALALETLKLYSYRGYTALCKETHWMWLELAKENLLPDPGTPEVWENVMCNCRI